MTDYREIARKALEKSKNPKKPLNESVRYPDGVGERMHKLLEDDIINSTHSLGKHPIFPEGDETSFESNIMGERFKDVVGAYKKAFDVDDINTREAMMGMMPLVNDSMEIEEEHRGELEKLAIDMVRKEYDMGEDVVEIHAELTKQINMVGTKLTPTPEESDKEFKSNDDRVRSTGEIEKRRFLNAMTQGAAKKSTHMFHLVDEELTAIDPRLVTKYTKMMAAADFMYYAVPDLKTSVNGGVNKVVFPSEENPKAVIYAQAMVFPVLIHEIVKGVMEILAAHGLPKDKDMGEYVISKADYLEAEPWDMRLGPALWEKFTDLIDGDDFHLKHHIYADLAAMPVPEFNGKMREIMGGTEKGKQIIMDIVKEIKADIEEDEFNNAMGGEDNDNDDDGLSYDELMRGNGEDILGDNKSDSDSDDDDDFDIKDFM